MWPVVAFCPVQPNHLHPLLTVRTLGSVFVLSLWFPTRRHSSIELLDSTCRPQPHSKVVIMENQKMPNIDEFLKAWKEDLAFRESRTSSETKQPVPNVPALATTADCLATINHQLVVSAWRQWRNGENEDCFKNCRAFLEYPETSELHKALCHFMLAHQDEEFL